MRVRVLHLRNFRRHADTRIELPDGVTALLGANGAGKSSLLEGLAFALFGTDGLRTGKSLVRMESAPPGDAVEAILDVELGGQALRIHRELRGKALTPQASLIVDGVVIVPAGAGSSEAVTQHIVRRLGMGPDAFFTTVVARQGELARLAQESPADRKRMVLRMLGIDRIDTAIDRARDQRRATQAVVEALRKVARDPKQAEAHLAESTTRASEASKALRAATAAWTASHDAVEAATTALAALQAQAEIRRSLSTEVESLRRDLRTREEALANAAAHAAEVRTARVMADATRPIAARLPELEANWLVANRMQAVARQRAVQEQAIRRLEQELAALVAARAALPPGPVEDGLAFAELQLEASQVEVDGARRKLAASQAILAAAKARRSNLAALGADAPCPTCERPLGGHLHQITQHTHDAEGKADQDVSAAKAIESTAAAALATWKARRDTALEHQRRRERHQAEAKALDDRRADLEARLAESRSQLPAESPAPEGLDRLRVELTQSRQAHGELQRLLGIVEREGAVLAHELAARAAHDAAAGALLVGTAALEAMPDVALALKAGVTRVADARSAERGAERTVQDAGRHEAACLQAMQQAEVTLAETRRIAAELAQANQEAQEWSALTDGTQGLLERFRDHVVDRIGPAIQAEASRLLSVFTGGRYTELLLDTSYNVYVTDVGVPYTLERFSGGEQDLAHLALRLAVSRLLAERSGGAELRFLALDEVFGSLDASRRDLVVGALRGLSGLYSQILVVSHQADLQEALDQALLVTTDGPAARIQNG